MLVIKRDGNEETFDAEKIKSAIAKAFDTFNKKDGNIVDQVFQLAVEKLPTETGPLHVEFIQDKVEEALMDKGCYAVARHYVRYRDSRAELRLKDGFKVVGGPAVKPPFGEIGMITHKRTYARRLNEDDPNDERTEEFRDTVVRVLKACQTQLDVGFTRNELDRAYDHMMKLKGTVGGRFLWQLGSKTVERFGLMSLQNCAFCAIDEPVRPFLWMFDVLMLGAGVGCSVQKKHVNRLPKIVDAEVTVVRKDTADADFIVPDSREGWVSLLKVVLESFFLTGESFTYSTVLVRPEGRAIRGFGGVSSGPEHLCAGIADIVKVMSRARNRQLRPTECMDVVDIIASIVVSGNVRRSAVIVIGDHDDAEFLSAKRWDLGNIPNWRAMSNNSVDCSDVRTLPREFWDGYEGNGEPYGLVNLDLCRKIGRTKDGEKYPDPNVEGFNPCGEIPLSRWQTCCLSEIFLPNVESFEELKDVAETLYRICKHSLRMKCHHRVTEEIVHDEMKIGIGITGYMQTTAEQKAWLSPLYEHLRAYDVEYSRTHGFPTSVKLTTVKPSGTLSLLAGVTPGCHPAIFRHFIRRIRVSTSNPLVGICKKRGYNVELQTRFDGSLDRETSIIQFPCKFPDTAVLAKDTTAIDQLEVVRRLQHDWADNAVSCTVYYHKEELPMIKRWLEENYTANLKSCSFLLHVDHGFTQAPYEEISKEIYEEMKANTTPFEVGFENMVKDGDDALESFECLKGACPVK